MEKLGKGSFGAVVKARHKRSGHLFAIKLVPFADSESEEEAMTEVSVMEGVDSKYIVHTYGRYLFGDHLWIVLEYCPGRSVAEVLRLLKIPLTENYIAAIVRDALLGLEYMHSQRKLHRDVKAGNILLSQDGLAKLADFGVAGQLSDKTFERNTLAGTPYWMAPEVILEKGYDGRADVWSLGITCIEMAHGKPPFHSVRPIMAMVLIPNKPPPTLDADKGFSEEFNDFVTLCLKKNPSERPTASELLKHPFIKKATSLKPLVEDIVIKISESTEDFGEDPNTAKPEAVAKQIAMRYSDSTSKFYENGPSDTVKVKSLKKERQSYFEKQIQESEELIRQTEEQLRQLELSLPKEEPPAAKEDLPSISFYYDQNQIEAIVNKHPLLITRDILGGVPTPNSISFDSKVVSRLHCSFYQENGKYYIADMGSSSGTFLNARRLSEMKVRSKPEMLKEGDEIMLGASMNEQNQAIYENDTHIPLDKRAVRMKVLMIVVSQEFPQGSMMIHISTSPSSTNLAKD